jgi:hypothetical protein
MKMENLNTQKLGIEVSQNSQKKLHVVQGFGFQLVRYVEWQSFTRGMGQIWLQVREESRQFSESYYHVLATSRNLFF